jgi:outer membrane protein TolC
VARARLFQALGRADDHKTLEGQLPENFDNLQNAQANARMEVRRDREQLIRESERARYLAASAGAHWMPSVSLFATHDWYNNYNHSVTDSDERFKSAYALGVQLRWNLFDGGAQVASQRQAALAQAAAEERLAKFDQEAPNGLDEARRRLHYDILSYKAKLSSVKKAEEAVRLARGGVRAGTLTNTQVLDAVVELNRAKAATVKTQMDAVEAWGQLELAIGIPN